MARADNLGAFFKFWCGPKIGCLERGVGDPAATQAGDERQTRDYIGGGSSNMQQLEKGIKSIF
jgi:hypothetical protein